MLDLDICPEAPVFLVTPLSTVNSSRAAANAGSATFSTARRKLKHRLVSSQFIEYTVGQNAHFQT